MFLKLPAWEPWPCGKTFEFPGNSSYAKKSNATPLDRISSVFSKWEAHHKMYGLS